MQMQMQTLGSVSAERLTDIASEAVSFGMQLGQANDPGNMEQLRLRIRDLLMRVDQRAQAAGIPMHQVEVAKFGLIALYDEIVMSSNWVIRQQWQAQPLQIQYFNRNDAGDEFFVKLGQLRGQPDPVAQDVLEVYYLCLTMGFRGRYVDLQGMATLRGLITEIGHELLQSRDHRLAPEFVARGGSTSVLKEFPAWIVLVICLGVIMALWMVFSSWAGAGWEATAAAIKDS